MKNQEKPRKTRRRLVKILGGLFVACILLGIAAYFYLSSAHFCRSFIFPRVGDRIHRELEAERIKISPLSRIELSNFSITNPDRPKEPPLVKLGGFVMNFSGFSFLKGSPRVDRLWLSKPETNVVLYADGKTNLEGIRPAGKKTASGEKKQPATLPDFLLKLVEVSDGSVRVSQMDKQGKLKRRVALENIDFKLTNLQPEQKSRAKLSLNFTMEDKEAKTRIDSSNLKMDHSFLVSRDLSRLNMDGELSLRDFTGSFQGNSVEGYELESTIQLEKDRDSVDLTPLSVNLRRGREIAASLEAKGNYDQKKGGGRFDLEVANIDRDLLNLVGSRAGNIDFRDTAISYKAGLDISGKGQKFELKGDLKMNRFSVLAPEFSKTPTDEMNLALAHEATYDGAKQILTMPRLDISAIQKGREAISGKLEKPLTLDLSAIQGKSPSAPPINYSLSVNRFDLTPFLLIAPLPDGTSIKTANLDSNVKIDFKDNGASIGVKGTAGLSRFSGKIMNNELPPTDFSLGVDLNVSNFSKIGIASLDFGMKGEGGPQNGGRLTGVVDLKRGQGFLNVESMDLHMNTINRLVPLENLTLKSGKISARASINMQKQFSYMAVKGSADVTGFSCLMKGPDQDTLIEIDSSTSLDVAYDLSGDLKIGGIDLDLKPGGIPSGNIRLQGDLNVPEGKGNLDLTAQKVNQDAVSAILSPYLKAWDLASLSVDSKQKITLGKGFQEISVKGETASRTPRLRDRVGGRDFIPPLELRVKNDLLFSRPKLTLRDLTLQANPPGKEMESVSLSGDILIADMQNTPHSKLNLRSKKLTLDRYMPPFMMEEKKGPAPSSSSKRELDPLDIGFVRFDSDVAIDQMKFRDVDITQVKGSVNLAENVLDLPGMAMKVNGADGTARGFLKFNLPGWGYSLDLDLKNIDMQPVVNSFAPRFKDQVFGKADFRLKELKGQGTTPPYLNRYLTGKIEGDLRDGKFTGLPILTALVDVTRIKALEELRFFQGRMDMDIGRGKIDINDLYFRGDLEKMGLKGWFGLDKTIDLSIQLALADPLSGKLKALKYAGDFMKDSEGYTELPVPVGMGGTFSHPIPTLKIGESFEETGKKLLKGLLDDQLKKHLDLKEKKPEENKEPPPPQ